MSTTARCPAPRFGTSHVTSLTYTRDCAHGHQDHLHCPCCVVGPPHAHYSSPLSTWHRGCSNTSLASHHRPPCIAAGTPCPANGIISYLFPYYCMRCFVSLAAAGKYTFFSRPGEVTSIVCCRVPGHDIARRMVLNFRMGEPERIVNDSGTVAYIGHRP